MSYVILQLKYIPQKVWYPEKVIGLLQEKTVLTQTPKNHPQFEIEGFFAQIFLAYFCHSHITALNP